MDTVSCCVLSVKLSQQFLVAWDSTVFSPSNLLPTVNILFFAEPVPVAVCQITEPSALDNCPFDSTEGEEGGMSHPV